MKRFLAAALLGAALLPAAVCAQALPDVDCFSPGLLRALEALAGRDALSVEASFTAEEALYARDLSVLQDMLSGTTLRYDGEDGFDRLRVVKGGETLLDAALFAREGGALASVNGQAYACADGLRDALIPSDAPDEAAAQAWTLCAGALLGRMPLEEIETALGGERAFGLTVVRPFSLERTMSDDGERYTRLDFSGALAAPDGLTYEASGYLRRPGGRAPKDTAEITLAADEENHFSVSVSIDRTAKVTRKDAAGQNGVQARLNAQGELEGSRVDLRMTVRLTDDWKTAEADALAEAVKASIHVGYTDRRPGRQMLRLNDLAFDLQTALSLTTREGENAPLPVDSETTLELVMDGTTFLKGGMSARLTAGGPAQRPEEPDGESAASLETAGDARALAEKTLLSLARALYARLGEGSLDRINKGLE